jgi:hypothetical protein
MNGLCEVSSGAERNINIETVFSFWSMNSDRRKTVQHQALSVIGSKPRDIDFYKVSMVNMPTYYISIMVNFKFPLKLRRNEVMVE